MANKNPPPTPWHQPQEQPVPQTPPPGYQQPPSGYQQPPPQYQWPQQQPQPPRQRHTVRNVLLSVAGVFVLLIVIGIVGALAGNPKPAANSGPVGQPAAVSTTPAAVSTTTPAAPAAVSTTTPAAPATTAPPAPSYTVPEQQAIDSAQSYIDMGNGFSKAGLIQQLDSPDGEGFSHKLAVFAVNHIHVNWYQQAVESAKGYMQMGGFSYSGLVQQLDSSYGEGFTVAQAEYAAHKVGL